MEDYSNQNGHSGYDPKYNPQSYGPNYDYGSYGNDPYGEGGPNKSVKGLKIMIVIMALILAALSAIYFLQVKQMKDDFAIERDTLTRQLTSLMNDYDTLKTMNDTLAVHYEGVKHQADSLLDKLQKERRLSYSKIRNYEKQMSYMRTVMEGYIRQIDSLNTLNKRLISENVGYRKEISSAKLRAEMAEEKAAELDNKVKVGSVLRARDIRLSALNDRSKPVSRVKNAARLRVDFVLAANELATPGNKAVYVRITSPDGYVLTTEAMPTFEFEGERLSYSAMREVDYQNQDLEVGIYFTSSGFAGGTYRMELYTEGRLIGQAQVAMR